MADGDEIAIFDGEDSVGATVVGTYEIDLVIASKDDGTGCGFTEGNPVIVRV